MFNLGSFKNQVPGDARSAAVAATSGKRLNTHRTPTTPHCLMAVNLTSHGCQRTERQRELGSSACATVQ